MDCHRARVRYTPQPNGSFSTRDSCSLGGDSTRTGCSGRPRQAYSSHIGCDARECPLRPWAERPDRARGPGIDPPRALVPCVLEAGPAALDECTPVPAHSSSCAPQSHPPLRALGNRPFCHSGTAVDPEARHVPVPPTRALPRSRAGCPAPAGGRGTGRPAARAAPRGLHRGSSDGWRRWWGQQPATHRPDPDRDDHARGQRRLLVDGTTQGRRTPRPRSRRSRWTTRARTATPSCRPT